MWYKRLGVLASVSPVMNHTKPTHTHSPHHRPDLSDQPKHLPHFAQSSPRTLVILQLSPYRYIALCLIQGGPHHIPDRYYEAYQRPVHSANKDESSLDFSKLSDELCKLWWGWAHGQVISNLEVLYNAAHVYLETNQHMDLLHAQVALSLPRTAINLILLPLFGHWVQQHPNYNRHAQTAQRERH